MTLTVLNEKGDETRKVAVQTIKMSKLMLTYVNGKPVQDWDELLNECRKNYKRAEEITVLQTPLVVGG